VRFQTLLAVAASGLMLLTMSCEDAPSDKPALHPVIARHADHPTELVESRIIYDDSTILVPVDSVPGPGWERVPDSRVVDSAFPVEGHIYTRVYPRWRVEKYYCRRCEETYTVPVPLTNEGTEPTPMGP
jgi:hypothetical protein